MSIFVMSRVMDSPEISDPGQLLTLLILANYADDSGGNIFPTVETIASKTRQSNRTVQRHLKDLIRDGFLKCTKDANFAERRPKHYKIIIQKLGIRQIDTGDKLSPQMELPVTNCHPTGDIVSPQGCHGVTHIRQLTVSTNHHRFTKPTIDDFRAYSTSIGLPGMESDKCYDYYESNGWKVGRNPMVDWKCAVRNWHRNWSQKKSERYAAKQKYVPNI